MKFVRTLSVTTPIFSSHPIGHFLEGCTTLDPPTLSTLVKFEGLLVELLPILGKSFGLTVTKKEVSLSDGL